MNKIRSPLFYVGDKYKIVDKISKYFPREINRFIEPFTGGGTVFLNTMANEYLINDIDTNVIEIHKYLSEQSGNPRFLPKMKTILDKYNLSQSYYKDILPKDIKTKWPKTYYAKFNKIGYNRLKDDYNSNSFKDPLKLYILLIYGFNRMLRFNSKKLFNIPVGNVDFNKNVYTALVNYFNFVRGKKIKLHSADYKRFVSELVLKKNDFIYFDPPYLITASEYNKYWNETNESELLALLDYLNGKGVKFALSNVLKYRGRVNNILQKWVKKYVVERIDSNYISYHNNSKKDILEVLIRNYAD